MKELSIEQKAKRYDQAIERAKEMIKAMTNIGGVAKVDDIQYLFPELAESEDERIRKALLTKFTNEKKQGGKYEIHGVSIDNIIAWLKNQGEQKAADIRTTGYWNIQEIEQKPAWSEEDNEKINSICNIIADKMFVQKQAYKSYYKNLIDFLKSLKERVQPKQDWSEEDKEVINLLLELVYEQDKISPRIPSNEKRKMMLSWLKSLKPQNKWKPSEEQMEALLYEVNAWDEDSVNGQNLKSLYQDLKKLREE